MQLPAEKHKEKFNVSSEAPPRIEILCDVSPQFCWGKFLVMLTSNI